MVTGVRGFNPIWVFVDLQGNILDDRYYMFVLDNEFPYLPVEVYHAPDLTNPWTNPIQFLSNGTLPVDIYFTPGEFYRLEIRKGDTQADPLIYVINNYQAAPDGSTPIDTIANTTTNQITNPQFALINFPNTYTLGLTNPDPIEFAPGWFFEAAGTGSVTFERNAFNNTGANPTNAPYAIHITSSGWTDGSVFIRQRFQQNGMLWANKIVSCSITGRIQGASQEIVALLVASNGSQIAQVFRQTIGSSLTEYKDISQQLPPPTNPNIPPNAYIDFKISLPSNINITLTSLQLLVQDLPIVQSYEQDSINRQIDHTFNYYKQPLSDKEINSLLIGWDFPLNPSQEKGTVATINTVADYVWDQTIAKSRTSTVTTARNAFSAGFQTINSGANEVYYIMQYLVLDDAKKTLATELSVNINAYKLTGSGTTDVTVRVYLFQGTPSATLPVLPLEIGTLNADGTFTLTQTLWHEVPRSNLGEARGILPVVSNNLQVGNTQDLKFSGWDSTTTTSIDKFAIIVTFSTPSPSTTVITDSISVVPGSIPTRPSPISYSETLRKCEYFWEKSYLYQDLPGTPTNRGARFATNNLVGSDNLYLKSFQLVYNQEKLYNNPIITFYSPAFSTPGYVQAAILRDGLFPAPSVGNNPDNYEVIPNWDITTYKGSKSVFCLCTDTSTLRANLLTAFSGDEGAILYHYTIDSRPGKI